MAYSIDDAWDNCREVMQAGTAAFGLYCRCGIWVARNLTDGFVPSEVATAYGSPEWVRKLVAVGLWHEVEGGYQMPHYLDRNADAATVQKRRQAEADRKARQRARAKQRRGPGGSPGGTPGGTPPGSQGGSPLSLSSPKGEGDAPPPAGGARPHDSTLQDVLRRDDCEHGAPDASKCALCRHGGRPNLQVVNE